MSPPERRSDEADERKRDNREGSREEDKPKSYGTILEDEIFQGLGELQRPASGLAMSGLSAGLDIGFSVLLMAVVLTFLGGDMSDPLTHFALAATYPVGFIFVVIGRSELFTEHTTLAIFPVLGGKAPVWRLARLWGIVYATNVVGAIVFAGLAVWIAPALGVAEESAFEEIARKLVGHTWTVILASAVLAGWLMGLLSWLVSAAQETISRVLLVWLTTASIGAAGLHHSIVGTVEVLAGVFVSPGLQWSDYAHFMIWTTLGNAMGGAFFVGLIKYGHAARGAGIPPTPLAGS